MVTVEVMGTLLFIAGLIMILIALVDLFNPLGIGTVERLVLFGAGVLTCVLGYFMANGQER